MPYLAIRGRYHVRLSKPPEPYRHVSNARLYELNAMGLVDARSMAMWNRNVPTENRGKAWRRLNR